MKTTIVVLTPPKSWSFTDQTSGEFKQGISAAVLLPFDGAMQTFSNLPVGMEVNAAYTAEIGFKIGQDRQGKPITSLKLVSVDLASKFPIDWSKILKR